MPTATAQSKNQQQGSSRNSDKIPALPAPKISHSEAVLLIGFAVMADVITLIPFVNVIASLLFGAFFQLYFYMKGVNGMVNVVGILIEAVPFLSSILPAMTVTIIMVIMIDHNKKLKKIERVAERTQEVSLKKAA